MNKFLARVECLKRPPADRKSIEVFYCEPKKKKKWDKTEFYHWNVGVCWMLEMCWSIIGKCAPIRRMLLIWSVWIYFVEKILFQTMLSMRVLSPRGLFKSIEICFAFIVLLSLFILHFFFLSFMAYLFIWNIKIANFYYHYYCLLLLLLLLLCCYCYCIFYSIYIHMHTYLYAILSLVLHRLST